MMPDESDLQ